LVAAFRRKTPEDRLADGAARISIMNRGTRRLCRLAGTCGIVGVLLILESFRINQGPPLTASDAAFIAYAGTHATPVLVGSFMQLAGPALIIAFALTLVSLAGGERRASGLVTIFGAGALMTTSMLEVTCYIGGLFVNPPDLPRIANTFGYAVQHLYFFVAAPALFLPLGVVLLESRVLPKTYAWLAVALGVTFAALGFATVDRLVLPPLVTAFAAIQALWWLAASVTLIRRSGRIAAEIGSRRQIAAGDVGLYD
jgi:hypothetical protein